MRRNICAEFAQEEVAQELCTEICAGVVQGSTARICTFCAGEICAGVAQRSVTRSCAELVTSLLLKMLNREKKRSFLFQLRGEGWCPVTPVGCRMVPCGPSGAGCGPVTPAGCRMVPCRPQDEGWSFFLRRGTSGSLAACNR